MKLKALDKNRPGVAFVGFPVDPTFIIRLIFILLRLILRGIPGLPVI